MDLPSNLELSLGNCRHPQHRVAAWRCGADVTGALRNSLTPASRTHRQIQPRRLHRPRPHTSCRNLQRGLLRDTDRLLAQHLLASRTSTWLRRRPASSPARSASPPPTCRGCRRSRAERWCRSSPVCAAPGLLSPPHTHGGSRPGGSPAHVLDGGNDSNQIRAFSKVGRPSRSAHRQHSRRISPASTNARFGYWVPYAREDCSLRQG